MNILHMIPGLAPSSGPTQALLNLTDRQAEQGHALTIVHLTGRGKEGARSTDPRIEQLGFPVFLLRNWGYSPSLHEWLLNNLRRFDIVHMHSMWLYPNLAGARACRRFGVPYVVRPAGSLEAYCIGTKRVRKAIYFRSIEKAILEQASFLHASSEQEARSIQATGIRNRIEVIPNGVPLKEFENAPTRDVARASLGLPATSPILLFLSRIHPKKGLELLGQCLSLVRQRIPNVHLVVVGPDQHSYAHAVKRQYSALGIAEAVTFLGERTGRDKVAAYAAADIFVLPTHSENFGIVVVESLAAGTPVVVSRDTPWQCLEEANAGCWLERNCEVFADCLVGLLRNPELCHKMGQNGKHLVRERFDWASIAKRLEESYMWVIHEGKSRDRAFTATGATCATQTVARPGGPSSDV